MAKISKIYGVGVNDSNYATREYDNSEGKRTIVWECPIFVTWKDMMKRCYSENYHKKRPTYKDCKVCNEWLSFMNFHKWAKDKIGKDPLGKKLHLDKDFKFKDNHLYSPKTCIFISNTLNNFISKDEKSSKGGFKGVGFRNGKYLVWCNDPLKRYSSFVGSYDCVYEASEKFISSKLQYLEDLHFKGFVPESLLHICKERVKEFCGEYRQ